MNISFVRRLGPTLPTVCAAGHHCPAVLELESGDFAIIGADITADAAGKLPAGTACGPSERVVLIPRDVLVNARPDIPGV